MLSLILALVSGCARLHTQTEFRGDAGGKPDVRSILKALSANDEGIRTMRARGRCVLTAPEIAGKRKCNVSIQFRAPSDLSVRGTHHLTGVEVFSLVCSGDRFVLDFPTENEQVRELEGNLSPSDLVREMFFPEEWARLKRRQVDLVDFGEEEGAAFAVFEVRTDSDWTRRVRVKGLPWVVTCNELMNADGEVFARTTREDYVELDGARFPTGICASFPVEETELKFNIEKDLKVNVELDESAFAIGSEKTK